MRGNAFRTPRGRFDAWNHRPCHHAPAQKASTHSQPDVMLSDPASAWDGLLTAASDDLS